MKTILISMIGTALLALWVLPVQAQTVTEDEAFTVAQNWVTLILQKEDKWGDSKTAGVQDIQEFKRGDRVIGYFCRVWPKGYIITSLRKELSPVKAYSATEDIDPLLEQGLMGLIKEDMENVLLEVEAVAGPIPIAPAENAQTVLEVDFKPIWEILGRVMPPSDAEAPSDIIPLNYQGGEPPLLTSTWDQGDPYNLQCPSSGGCSDAHCAAGCGPIAGAQTMRYWAWPPGYDWVNMPDRAYSSSLPAIRDAVSTLCHDYGVDAGANYCSDQCETGICFAGCPGSDMLDAFEDHFSYNKAADNKYRIQDTNAATWFGRIKDQLNLNRPVPYRVKNHIIVCDGWKEYWEGSNYIRQYHMNYGWANSNTTWYTLDGLLYGGKDEEIIIVNLYPVNSLGGWLSGSPEDAPVLYGVPGSTYRYFDQNAMGRNVAFEAGHNLQFLAGVSVRGTSPVGDSIRFSGIPSATTRMFSIKGTATGGSDAGIMLYNGAIQLYNTGSIKFH